ncbi:ABC transporter ATP-binding protein [Streptomyces sp. NPDC059466]|uniref:ABC transporter ATP-binding protein n=1 Tax=unclassified Streptomyces TaxID=2593676 RepID=UPI0036BD8A55
MATDVHRPMTAEKAAAAASTPAGTRTPAQTPARSAAQTTAETAAQTENQTQGRTRTASPTQPPAPARVEAPAPLPAVRVQGLTRAFDGRAVIDDLHLDVRPGEFVALLGRSGCGKSTLLRILAGLDREIEGSVLVPRRKAVAFQAPRLMPWKRVWRNVLLGLPGKPERPVAERALAEVGLTERSAAWPRTLSGGEAQRASLARALVREPDLLLLDEPFGALDALTRITAQRLVGEVWRRRGCAVLLVTHDVEEAVLLADRVLVMDEGAIAYETRVELDRPRDIADPRFAGLRAGLLERLGVDGTS